MAVIARLAIVASAALALYAQAVPDDVATHAQAAQEAERRNDFRAAVREYEYVVSKLPQSAEMQSNLGVALYFDHELMRAITVFRRAITLNPNLIAPHLFSGLAFYRLSNPDAAVPELERAVQIDRSDVIARSWLGYAYVAQSRYDSALKEFQAACKLDPGNIDVWYSLGHTYLEVGRKATIQLLSVAPDGARTWQLAGEQEKLQGHAREALEDYQGALKRCSDIPEVRAAVAELGGTVIEAPAGTPHANGEEDDFYWRAHDAEQQAREAFEHVVQIAPNSYRAHQIMADALAVQQRQGEAIAEYRMVLQLKPDLPGIHQAIGNNLLQTGKLTEALKEFQAELAIQPRSARVLTDTAETLLLMGNDDEAATTLMKALQMDRPPPDAYRVLGKLDLQRRQYKSAVNALTHYVSIVSDDSRAYYLLASAYRELGEREQTREALSLYQKTSQDAKARSRAQQALQLNDSTHVPEDTADLQHSTAH